MKPILNRPSLKTPRAAAIAGILFSLLYGTSLILIQLAVSKEGTGNTTWLEENSGTISFALNLIPYAGIAFLWFIGVIRDRVGESEDRFLATVFLGSGLLFLAMIFVGVALAGGLLAGVTIAGDALSGSGVVTFSRAVMYNLTNIFAIRMEGVFMISLSTIWLRTGLLRRLWSIITYGLALVLLLSVSLSTWVSLIFPVWVFAVSFYFLVFNYREEMPNPGTVKGA